MTDTITLPENSQKADTVFDFSVSGFTPPSPFGNNTPVQTEEQRNWQWGAPPVAQVIPAEPIEPPVDTSNRQIANFRRKIMPKEKAPKAQKEEMGTKEPKNVERLRNEHSFLKEHLKRAYIQIQEQKQEQAQQQVIIDKQEEFHKTLDRTIRELVKVADESEKNLHTVQADFLIQQKDIAGLRQGADELKGLLTKKMAAEEKADELHVRLTELQNRNEALEKSIGAANMAAEEKTNELLMRMTDLQSRNGDLEQNMGDANKAAEEKANELLGRITDLQNRNQALEKNMGDGHMATSQQQAQMEELRISVRLLEQQREGLNTEFDSMQGRLEAAEKKLSRTSVSYRQAQTAISNNNATIKGLERQISKFEHLIGQHEQELEKKDSRIRSRDEELKDKAAEIASLSSLNDQLRQENTRLIAQNQKLEAHAQRNIDEVEALRAASQDYVKLEIALGEAQANADQLSSELVALELLNSELKSRLDDHIPFAGTSHGRSNLQTELSQSDFREADDEAAPALNDGTAGGSSQEDGASAEITTPENLTAPHDINEAPELLVFPQAITSHLIDRSSRLTRSQGTAMVPEAPQTDPVTPLPVFILKKHNPFHCWLQVYLDLWALFVFWFGHRLYGSFGGPPIMSPSKSLARRDAAGGSSSTNSRRSSNGGMNTGFTRGERADASLPVSASEDIASWATTARSSTGDVQPDKERPDFWITVLTFCFHLLFYAIIIICVSNYHALVHERSIWLSANEVTRQYLQHFFKISFKPEYGIIHEIFGPVEFLDVWRYNVHNWVQIDRSLPG